MLTYISIIVTAIFVNNIVLAQFLGICPFLGVSKKLSSATGMGMAVAFVMTLATCVTWLIQKFVLDTSGLGYMQTIVFILVIAALVQMLEIIIKKIAPPLYEALLVIQKGLDLGQSVVYAIATAIGFTLALVIFAGIREHLELINVPQAMRGVPIALICAGLLAMAFMGFSGITIG